MGYRKTKIGMILLFGILFLGGIFSFSGFASATFSVSTLSSPGNPSPTFDSSMCTKGQDFLVQVAPSGCQPVPVRSDLLSSQNVQVYCPLAATQLNPLVNVNSINGISVTGNYPSEIASVGYYPAQAALSTNGQSQSYPVLSNIGYAVINLKQQPNESAMPDYVAGNLTASLSYSASNVLGLGTVDYYLPQLSDLQWQTQYPNYGFWGGKGYVRVNSVQNGQAMISVYDKNLNHLSTVTLQPGQTSGEMSVPGFDLCSASMKIKLNSIQNPNTMARFNVNGNIVEVSSGDSFLNNHCRVVGVNKQGLVQSVQVSCSTDSGQQTFTLAISPSVVLEINGKKGNYNVGQFLFSVKSVAEGTSSPTSKANQIVSTIKTKGEAGHPVYLGYVGSKSSDSSGITNMNNFFVYLAILPPPQEANMSATELASFAGVAGLLNPGQMSGNPLLSAISSAAQSALGIAQTAEQFLTSGRDIFYLPYNQINNDLGESIKFDGFASGHDTILGNNTVSDYYTQANADYNTIQNIYSSEKYPSTSPVTLGEQAAYNQLLLAKNLGQKDTLQKLCQDFLNNYPSATEDTSFCKDVSELSSSSNSARYVTINGQAYLISFSGIFEPSSSDFGAEVQVTYPDGHSEFVSLSKDQKIILNSTNNDFIQLESLTDNTATVNVKAGLFSSGSLTLKQGVPQALTSTKGGKSYTIDLERVNLTQFAQVSLIPNINNAGSQITFPFNISIEKRSIQLSPEKTKETIKKINDSISQLEQISNVTSNLLGGLSTACKLTGSALTAINFLKDLGGTGAARTLVMTSAGGWNEKCTDLVNKGEYSSIDQCFTKNSQNIDNDVNQVAGLMSKQNSEIKTIQSKYTTTSVLSQSVVDTNKFMQDYSVNVASAIGAIGESSIVNPSQTSQSISLADAKNLVNYTNFADGNFNTAQARDIELYSEILSDSSSSDVLTTIAKQGLYSTLAGIQTNRENRAQQAAIAAATNMKDNVYTITAGGKVTTIPVTSPVTFAKSNFYSANKGIIPNSNYVALVKNAVTGSGQEYLVDYSPDGLVNRTYSISGEKLSPYQTKDKNGNIINNNPLQIQFKFISAGTYKNAYKNAEVQYFETAPYKGYPAIVPFDLKNGWYAAIKPATPSISLSTGINPGNTAVDASGRVNSFYLCNVGANGLEEFGSSAGDDICESMNIGTGLPYDQFPGLDSNQAAALVREAVGAIQQAATARANNPSGLSSVTITAGGVSNNIKVGQPAASTPAIQCQDFMSPKECTLLFNVCDPVVCPPSRCNFGGAYPVSDVIQTGVIGGLFLCLPNAREGIVMPVCLTGVNEGLKNWITVEKSWRDCLQNNLKTGQTTGICDETAGFYGCQLFWQEAAPLANVALPSLAKAALGQNVRGGGEYSNFQSALSTAQQSVSYLNNVYSSSSFKAFTINTSSAGFGFCKNFVSTVFPSEANIASQLATVDSPPQYTGSFSSTSYTTATVPATDMYKVYFHIYAGQNSAVYYSVYLKNSGSSYYQDSSATRLVDSGYITAGNYTDQTKTFTAPAGYTQMCISVNGQENCKFQQVSTSLLTNAVQDAYVASQANNTDITTSTECTSGTINLAGFLNPNLQAGLTNAVLNPSISKFGINRICATQNPGLGSDPNANTQGSRWVKVGYCDNQNMGCWLDTQSVQSAINSPDFAAYLSSGKTTTLQSTTVQSLESAFSTSLLNSGNYLTDSEFASDAQKISKEGPNSQLSDIQSIISKVFYNNQKAELLLLRGGAYGELALEIQREIEDAANPPTSTSTLSGVCKASYPDATCCDSNPQACISGGGKLSSSAGSKTSGTSAKPAPAGSGQSQTTSSITSDEILKAMNYANPQSSSYGKSPIGNRNCNCGSNSQCKGYADTLTAAANSNGENPLLLLSVMMQESQCNASAVHGVSKGIMQISSFDLCTSIGSQADITSDVAKNIQCGALILKNKYDNYGVSASGTHYPYPSGTCDGFSITYYGWNASLRGYLGYKCAGNPEIDVPGYVDNVNLIFNTLAKYLGVSNSLAPATTSANNQQKQPSGQAPGSATAQADCLQQGGTWDSSTGKCTSVGNQQPTTNTLTLTIQLSPASSGFVSPNFSLEGVSFTILGQRNTPPYFRYTQGQWQWSNDGETWVHPASNGLPTVGANTNGLNSGSAIQTFKSIYNQPYDVGLEYLIDLVAPPFGVSSPQPTTHYSALDTKYALMRPNGQFTYQYYPAGTSGASSSFLFKFNSTTSKWYWSPANPVSWKDVSASTAGLSVSNAPLPLINSLVGKDFYSGAELIFDSVPVESSTVSGLATTPALSQQEISGSGYPSFEYENYYYKYAPGSWYWSSDGKAWNALSDISGISGYALNALIGLQGKGYADGLNSIMNEVSANPGSKKLLLFTNYPTLSVTTNSAVASMDHTKQFAFTSISTSNFPSRDYDFRFSDNQWQWRAGGTSSSWYTVPDIASSQGFEDLPAGLIKNLDGKDFNTGAQIIFNTSAGLISPGVTGSLSSSGGISQDMINNYAVYSNLFDKYSKSNLPSGWSQNSFKAFLVAIADNESGLANANWLMGYPHGVHSADYYQQDISWEGAEKQVSAVSTLLKNVFDGTGSSSDSIYASYVPCYTKTSTDQMECVLSVYYNGKTNSVGVFGHGGNPQGVAFAGNVLTLYNKWLSYFNSQNS